jgi:hypothetical protein
MKKALSDLSDVIKSFFRILSWFETWVPSLVAVAIVAFWFVFAFALSLPNPWKSILVWAMFFSLAVLAHKR